MDDIEVIKKFALAERKFTLIIFISVLLFLSTFIAEQLGFGYLNPAYGFLAGFALFIFGVFRIYKCPKCGSMPKALGTEGIQISPKACGHCGVKLR